MMTGADKSGDDVHCESDADDVSSHDGDSDPSCYVFPDFDQLDISCSKDSLDHEQGAIDPFYTPGGRICKSRCFPLLATSWLLLASPEFCAKNCVYRLMHEELNYILHIELVDIWHSQLKSAGMERVGCERALDFLMQKLKPGAH